MNKTPDFPPRRSKWVAWEKIHYRDSYFKNDQEWSAINGLSHVVLEDTQSRTVWIMKRKTKMEPAQ